MLCQYQSLFEAISGKIVKPQIWNKSFIRTFAIAKKTTASTTEAQM